MCNTRYSQISDNYRAALTLKYLLGVGSGKWILGLDWIDECLEQGRMVDEEPYEALDFVGDSVPFDCRVNGAPNKLFEDFELAAKELSKISLSKNVSSYCNCTEHSRKKFLTISVLLVHIN